MTTSLDNPKKTYVLSQQLLMDQLSVAQVSTFSFHRSERIDGGGAPQPYHKEGSSRSSESKTANKRGGS